MKPAKRTGKTPPIGNVLCAASVLGKWLKFSFYGLVLLAFIEITRATPQIATDSPVGFFTNVAARLLSAEMNLDLNHIQVYPTNQYTPAVHRLLQVTANIFDATSTNYYPSVFRPVFSQDASGNVFIVGYTNLSDDCRPGERSQLPHPWTQPACRGRTWP